MSPPKRVGQAPLAQLTPAAERGPQIGEEREGSQPLGMSRSSRPNPSAEFVSRATSAGEGIGSTFRMVAPMSDAGVVTQTADHALIRPEEELLPTQSRDTRAAGLWPLRLSGCTPSHTRVGAIAGRRGRTRRHHEGARAPSGRKHARRSAGPCAQVSRIGWRRGVAHQLTEHTPR